MECDEKTMQDDEAHLAEALAEETSSLRELNSWLRHRHLELEGSLRSFMERHDQQMKQLLDHFTTSPLDEVSDVDLLLDISKEASLPEEKAERRKPKLDRGMSEFSLGEGLSKFRMAKSKSTRTFEQDEGGKPPIESQRAKLRQRVRNFLGYGATELCIAAMTLLSAFVVGFQVEEAAQNASNSTFHPNLLFTIINHALTLCFSIELTLRVFAYGKNFIWSEDLRWNLLDVVIVVASLVELIWDIWMSMDSGGGVRFSDLSMIKAMRVVRILRLVRVFRVVRFFRSLRVLIASIIHTLRSVVWALTLLTLIMYTFAILFTYCYTDFVNSNPNNLEQAERLRRYFGSVPQSILNLFAAISDGISWVNISTPLLEAGWLWLALFLFYIALVTFAVLNVVTGVFCQNAIESASLDQEMVIEAQLKSKKMYTDQVRMLFHLMDEGQRGELTANVFEEHINEPQVAAYFRALDMDLNNAWKLFTLLDPDNSGTIDLNEFVEGCLKLRGPATRLDMEMVLSVARSTAKRQNQLVGKLERLERQIAKRPGQALSRGVTQEELFVC